MAVGNLPNELPRDASRYFGEQLIKYVLEDLFKEGSSVIERATIVRDGRITAGYKYLEGYASFLVWKCGSVEVSVSTSTVNHKSPSLIRKFHAVFSICIFNHQFIQNYLFRFFSSEKKYFERLDG